MSEIHIAGNPEELSEKAAEFFVEIANASIRARDRFSVALSGGSTPKRLYQKLVARTLDWKKVFFFFGDERNVPPDHEQSNFRMVNESLFQPLNVADSNIYRWKTEMSTPDVVAEDYTNELSAFFQDFSCFDLILLGLGNDGHTASLFPHTAALNEKSKIAVPNFVGKFGEYRFTLTFPVINNAANITFLVSGSDKATTLKNVIEGVYDPADLPAQSVLPENGTLHWFLDKDSASLLNNE